MSGNGVDIAAVYQLLSQVAETVTRHDRLFAIVEQTMTTMRAEMSAMRTEMSAMRTDLIDLRQAVTHYHSSVIGHGILISDLEARMRRVEERLDLSPLPTG